MALFPGGESSLLSKVILGFILSILIVTFMNDTLMDNSLQLKEKFIRPLNNTLEQHSIQIRQIDQMQILQWFEIGARRKTKFLHEASNWDYLSEKQFNNIVDHVLIQIPIRQGNTIFELGCGVGAVLQRIRQIHGTNISLGGSDLSVHAIEKVRKVFPREAENFYVLSMTKKNDLIPENSQDHVISFGALAMYLYKDQMEEALQEAIRIIKPGGRMCFTHFIEPGGKRKWSIIEPVKKSYWSQLVKKYFLQNLVILQMVHQGDRYFVCFSKSV